jgi:hypothetical protein
MISLPTNDSAEQTKAVLRQVSSTVDNLDLAERHQLQDWVATAERQVVISFAMYLANTIPPVAVRLRRDFRSGPAVHRGGYRPAPVEPGPRRRRSHRRRTGRLRRSQRTGRRPAIRGSGGDGRDRDPPNRRPRRIPDKNPPSRRFVCPGRRHPGDRPVGWLPPAAGRPSPEGLWKTSRNDLPAPGATSSANLCPTRSSGCPTFRPTHARMHAR